MARLLTVFASLLLAAFVAFAPCTATARSFGGGHGFGGHGFGGFRGVPGGFHGPFRGRAFGFGFGAPFLWGYPYYWGYPGYYGYPGCVWVHRLVHTRYGLRRRLVRICY